MAPACNQHCDDSSRRGPHRNVRNRQRQCFVRVRVCVCALACTLRARARCQAACGSVSRLYFESQRPEERTAAGQRNSSSSLTFIRPPLHRRAHTSRVGAAAPEPRSSGGLTCLGVLPHCCSILSFSGGGSFVPSERAPQCPRCSTLFPLRRTRRFHCATISAVGGCQYSDVMRRDGIPVTGTRGRRPQIHPGALPQETLRVPQKATHATMRAGRKTSRPGVEQSFLPKHKSCLNCYHYHYYYYYCYRTALGFCF